jgi:TolB-like protein
MGPQNFFGELKRRNVYRVAVAYAVVGWLLIQIATQVFPFFEIPNWAVRLVVVVIALGFPIALILAWAFELTPEGIMRADEVPAETSVQRSKGRRLDFFIIAVLVAAVALLVFDRWRGRDGGTIAPDSKSIAVLPFQNLSRDPDNAFFADGMQDEILTDLARVADLKVISRTSVQQYKSDRPRNLREIGQQLGVAHVLEGSVQRAGNRVRVNAQLVDARTDRHLWAETYDRDLADVFAIQSEIAKSIARELRAKISPGEKEAIDRPGTADVVALELYMRARALTLATGFSADASGALHQAVQLLGQALARDPSFYEAQCEVASAHIYLYYYGNDHTPARLAQAEEAIQKALRIRPDGGEAHLARAENLYRAYRDYEGALAALEQARRVLPNDSRVFALRGYIERRQNKHEQALVNLERALELDPRNLGIAQQISISYDLLRRYPEEIRAIDRALAIKPDDLETHAARADVFFNWQGDIGPLSEILGPLRRNNVPALKQLANFWIIWAVAERNVAEAEAALAALPEAGFRNNEVFLTKPFLRGLIARMGGDAAAAQAAFTVARAEQEKTVQSQPDYGPPLVVLAMIEAGLGRKEEALAAARRAVELLPPEKDPVGGAHMLEYSAVTAAWVGEKGLACEWLKRAEKLPGAPGYGQLKLFAYWDPLRGEACFEEIVASLAPRL